ncbi:MAG: hypothetical protein DRJ47_11470 [Thermoprotei archaeon]|nr:MAG: hypothetical protein DRJ47_11470 [Thermoprotei archaeon]
MLGVDLFAALRMPDMKLDVLYNEALRQRALDMLTIAVGSNYSENKGVVEKALKIHGVYTEGFYKQELARLREAVKSGI